MPDTTAVIILDPAAFSFPFELVNALTNLLTCALPSVLIAVTKDVTPPALIPDVLLITPTKLLTAEADEEMDAALTPATFAE